MTPAERLAEVLIAEHPDDAARALEQRPPAEVAALLGELETDPAAGVLAQLDATSAAAALEALEADDAAALLTTLAPGHAANMLRRMPAATTAAILAACPPGFSSAVRAVIAHPARSAGAMMDPHAPSLPRDLAVATALAAIRERPERFKHYIYLVDRAQVLVGVARLIDLVAAPPERLLEDVMRSPVARIVASDLEPAVLAHPGWQRYTSLPVVDHDNRLVGVIRDDVVRSLAQRTRSTRGEEPISLAVSLAELFWLGLAGVTEGVASVVGRETERTERDRGRPRDRERPE